MLSALIPSEHSYPAFALGKTTGTPEVRFSRSSRTEENSSANILRPHQIETDNTVTLQNFEGIGHFCQSLHIAMQFGLYLWHTVWYTI